MVSCSHAKKLSTNNAGLPADQMSGTLPHQYRVTKIDSVNKVYLIYAKEDTSLYKIVSAKDSTETCINIRVNGEYGFMLHSLFPRQFLGKYDLSPAALPNVDGVIYNGTPVTVEKGCVKDLFVADNVKGLCAKLQ